MGTTPIAGLPYPEPSDPVAAGADAIKNLALKIEPGAWQTLAPATGWALYAAYGINAGYRLDVGGWVSFRGHIQRTGAAITSGDNVIANLPVGFRPLGLMAFPAWYTANTILRLVASATTLSVQPTGISITSGSVFSLECVRYAIN